MDDARQRRRPRMRHLTKGRIWTACAATALTVMLGVVVAVDGYADTDAPPTAADASAGAGAVPAPAAATTGTPATTVAPAGEPAATGSAPVPSATSTSVAPPASEGTQERIAAGPPGSGWRQIWGDEFAGTAVDRGKWISGDGYRQQDTCHYPQNVTVSDGTAKLKVLHQKSDCGGDYSGAILWSAKKNFRYGYMEARIRYKIGPGMWGNFWTVGYRNGKTVWPPEFDTGETVGNKPGKTLMAFHHSRKNGKLQSAMKWVDLDSSQWHTYGVEYLRDQQVRQFIDGKLVHETKIPSPDIDQYIVLRMGGAAKPDWGGVPDETSDFPGVAEYDWVRVHTKSSGD